jgi:DNA-binding Lrp family transcriptional regulator
MTVVAIVLIEAQPARIADLATELVQCDGVHEVHSVAGGEVDLVAIIRVANHEGIANVVTESVAKLDGIVKTKTLIAFRSYSDADLDAAYEGFGS